MISKQDRQNALDRMAELKNAENNARIAKENFELAFKPLVAEVVYNNCEERAFLWEIHKRLSHVFHKVDNVVTPMDVKQEFKSIIDELARKI